MCPRQRSRGYTLVEVLVAFMIMALALTVLLRIFSNGVRSVAVSSDYAQAVLIGESRLATAGVDDMLAPGETSGVDGRDFSWTRRVVEYQPAVDYTWPNGDKKRSIDLSTVKLLHEKRGS
ncbi:MAG: prepilin-type N-terminal cleavage/methylation domain-containing protein [Gammaproteobacteria bacterium]|nr:prepilin-type N-terminal cleavage/methylation domain-containing protein [Gammaproteobacteria bacterium]